MSFHQQVHVCEEHTVVDPTTRAVQYGCYVIYGVADDGTTVVWESHDDAESDPAARINPDIPAFDHTVDPPVPMSPGYPAWVQPTTGATDAYSLGARVTHNQANWQSNVDANVWEPGVYGWDRI
jgi:hypothetical protein